MDGLFTVLLIFISGFITGWFWHARSMFRRVTDNPEKMIDLLEKYKKAKAEMDDEESPITTEVKVEKMGNQFYLFTKDTDEFLAQGHSLEEALEAIKKRFPDRNFKGIVTKEQAEKMGLSKQS